MATRIIIPRRTLFMTTLAMAAIILAFLGLIYLPQATIRIEPLTTERAAKQMIVLSTQVEEPNFAKFILPAEKVETTLEESEEAQRTGAATFDDFARGAVVLINETEEEQQLLPRTHLRHQQTGVFFLTDSPVAIPAHGRVSMKVTAKEKGKAGNVPAGKFMIDKLAPSLQTAVYAESSQGFEGGIAVESPLSEKELVEAKEKALARARERILGELTVQAHGATIAPPLMQIDVVEDQASAQAGSRTQAFSVRLKVRGRALVVDENDLLSLTLLALRSLPAHDEEFLSYKPESFRFDILRADFERGEAQIQSSLTGVFAHTIGPATFQGQQLAGLTPPEVQEQFKRSQGVGKVEVELFPFWVRRVPGRAGAVEVVVSQKK